MAAYSSILAWRIHGRRSRVGPSPWDHKRPGHSLRDLRAQGSVFPRSSCRWLLPQFILGHQAKHSLPTESCGHGGTQQVTHQHLQLMPFPVV